MRVPANDLNAADQSRWPPAARTIEATAAHYGWTRTFIFARLAGGDLEALKAGRRTLVTTESADRLFRSLPRARYGAPRTAAANGKLNEARGGR